MTSRTRTRKGGGGLQGEVNSRFASGQPDTIRSYKLLSNTDETCQDTSGFRNQDNIFSLTRREKIVAPITGPSRAQTGPFSVYIVGSPPPQLWGLSDGYGDTTHLTLPTASSSAMTDKLLSRSSPSRPIVDIPVFLFELKDLPNMIRQAGRAIKRALGGGGPPPSAKGVASAHLAYNFGWAPLIDDLSKLLDWRDAVDRKMDQLRRLHSKGGMRRNLTLDSASATSGLGTVTVQSSGITIRSNPTKTTTRKVWGSVRWLPKAESMPKGGGGPSYGDAFRAAFGLDLTFSTIWEALPWSWLIDWFSSVGDYLGSHRNTIPATPTRINIMEMTETVTNYPVGSVPNGFGWGGATCKRVTKTRTPTTRSVLPTGYLPFLSGFQLSILGALAIVRAK